jgi:hypothetical protein
MLRSCEENLARRAWASEQSRRPATLRQTLRNLLPVLNSPRPLYGRVARQALAGGDREKMLDAIAMVCQEIDFCRADRAKFNARMGRPATASYG